MSALGPVGPRRTPIRPRSPVLLGLEALGWFRGDSWTSWWSVLRALFGDPLLLANPADVAALALYQQCTGRQVWPATPAEEAWVIAGRRAGKTLTMAKLAVATAVFLDAARFLAPGERAVVMALAADREQAAITIDYVRGLLDSDPALARLVESRTRTSIRLSNRVDVQVHTSSYRAVRGYSLALAICDEVSFWRDEDSSNPAAEVITALRPALATLPGSRLIAISTPYARSGPVFDMHEAHFGREGDPVLVWKASSATMNPSLDPGVIARAKAADPAAARAEWEAEFRSDLEKYVTSAIVDACTPPGRLVLPPTGEYVYAGFVDPSGLGTPPPLGDSMTLAIAHRDPQGTLVLDLVEERRPPASPAAVTAEFAEILRRYGLTYVVGDRFAGSWPAERFAAEGIAYIASARTRSEIYLDVLPSLVSGQVELLESPRLRAQLLGLERRVGASGRDAINHAPGRHDDLINAAAGALLLAAEVGAATPVDVDEDAGIPPEEFAGNWLDLDDDERDVHAISGRPWP